MVVEKNTPKKVSSPRVLQEDEDCAQNWTDAAYGDVSVRPGREEDDTVEGLEDADEEVGSDSDSSSSSSLGDNALDVGDPDLILEDMGFAEMQEVPSVPEDYEWVNGEVCGMASKIDPNSNLVFALNLEMGIIEGEKWVIRGVSDIERVCQVPPKKYVFYIYYETLAKIHARPPFTVFEQTILRELSVAPTQLHLNSWAFQILLSPRAASIH